MDTPWLPLLFGLVLGVFPPRWLLGGECRHRTLVDAVTGGNVRVTGDSGEGRRRRVWWKIPLFWVDPFRGYFCAFFLARGLARFPQETTEQTLTALSATCLVTLVVLVVQMELGRQRRGDILAPVAFLLGYTIGFFPGYEITSAAVALIGLATMIAGRNFTAGYLIAGACALGFGYPAFGLGFPLAVFAVTAAAPVPYAFFRRARLVIPVRA